MKKLLLIISLACISNISVFSIENPQVNCLNNNFDIKSNPYFYNEFLENQKFTEEYIESNKLLSDKEYIIPVVFHVFGTDFAGTTVTETTIINSLEHTNKDFFGLNADFLKSDPHFEEVRGKLNIKFKLAKIDPDGNPTNGIVFYEPESMGLANNNNQVDNFISSIAWDNYSYMNVYITLELTGDGVENLSGFAYYPHTGMSNQGLARVVYNGRYLFGNTNEKFASVLSHEFGHWLNLMHTFEGGCTYPNDHVDDTPPVDNLAMGCGAENCETKPINAENFMDYNWTCYSMFTAGQIERVEAALQLPSRVTLWQESNLTKVGLLPGSNVKLFKEEIKVFPNPTDNGIINISNSSENVIINQINICDSFGRTIMELNNLNTLNSIDVSKLADGFYILQINSNQGMFIKKLIIQKK